MYINNVYTTFFVLYISSGILDLLFCLILGFVVRLCVCCTIVSVYYFIHYKKVTKGLEKKFKSKESKHPSVKLPSSPHL